MLLINNVVGVCKIGNLENWKPEEVEVLEFENYKAEKFKNLRPSKVTLRNREVVNLEELRFVYLKNSEFENSED